MEANPTRPRPIHPHGLHKRQGQTGTAVGRSDRTTTTSPSTTHHHTAAIRGTERRAPAGRESRTEMRRPHGGSSPSQRAFLLVVATGICAQFTTVLAGDPQTSKDDKKAEAQSKGHTGQTVLFVLLGIGAAILLSFFIFKYWQKKKREEQHARLLKLFEEDDDIEVELGLRD